MERISNGMNFNCRDFQMKFVSFEIRFTWNSFHMKFVTLDTSFMLNKERVSHVTNFFETSFKCRDIQCNEFYMERVSTETIF